MCRSIGAAFLRLLSSKTSATTTFARVTRTPTLQTRSRSTISNSRPSCLRWSPGMPRCETNRSRAGGHDEDGDYLRVCVDMERLCRRRNASIRTDDVPQYVFVCACALAQD